MYVFLVSWYVLSTRIIFCVKFVGKTAAPQDHDISWLLPSDGASRGFFMFSDDDGFGKFSSPRSAV